MTQETYTHGHSQSVVKRHASRTADEAAAFFRPLLRPDMRLLDIGCGPGSITVGIAGWLTDGHVTGVDLDDSVLDSGRALATERGLANVEFRQASVYDLPFDEGEFDAVYVHQVLQHLGQPVEMLIEARRVLRPDAPIGVREVDWGSATCYPAADGIARFLELYHAVAARNGGDADIGRRLRSLFVEAGFADVDVGAGVWAFGSPDETRDWGEQWAERVTTSSIAEKAVEYGLATPGDLQSIAEAWRAWGNLSDAYFCFTHAEATGRKPA